MSGHVRIQTEYGLITMRTETLRKAVQELNAPQLKIFVIFLAYHNDQEAIKESFNQLLKEITLPDLKAAERFTRENTDIFTKEMEWRI